MKARLSDCLALYYDNADRDCYWEKMRISPVVASSGSALWRLDGALPPTTFVEVNTNATDEGSSAACAFRSTQLLQVAAGEEISIRYARWPDSSSMKSTSCATNVTLSRAVACVTTGKLCGQESDSDLRITFDTGIAYRMDNLIPLLTTNVERYLLPEGYSVMR